MDFKVNIEEFEGPIGLLLELIEKRKMPINDISLAEITDDFIRYIGAMETDLLSDKTYFIFVASTLVLIKSKSILPTLELTEEETQDINSLKKRIELFKIYQDASLELKSHMQKLPGFYYPKARKKEIIFSPHEGITPKTLYESMTLVFTEVPEKPKTKKEGYIKIAVHIEEMMISLEERIKTAATDFHSFVGNFMGDVTEPKQIRTYRVVGFLAMLELVKNGALDVLQENNFSDIAITPYE